MRTYKPALFLVTISLYLATFFKTNPILWLCKGCRKFHLRRTLCFPPTVMNRHHLQTLKALLDGTLNFSWDNNEHFLVFSLCNYFLLDETYILPLFKSSLKLEYAFRYDHYRYFYFVYIIHAANFRTLSTFLADWLALHFPLAGLTNAQLSLISVSQSYGFFCHIVHRNKCHYLRGENKLPPVKLIYTPSELAADPTFPTVQ